MIAMMLQTHEKPTREAEKKELHFSLDSLNALDTTEDKHFWSRTKRGLALSLLKRYIAGNEVRLVDVGCGNGGFLASVEKRIPSARLTGIDGYAESLRNCRKRSHNLQLIEHDITEMEGLPEMENNVATFLDVLEHLDSPEKTLNDVRRIMSPNGIVIATVPAFQSLWTDRDVFLGHRKRYSKRDLVKLFSSCGYEILEVNYYFSYLFLPVLLYRKLIARFMRKTGEEIENAELRIIPVLNYVLTIMGKLECMLTRSIPLPFGTSVYCVARSTSTSS